MDKWHHVCLTWKNTEANYTFYVDGVQIGEQSVSKDHVIAKGAIVLGQDQDSYNLTSVSLWDKALTAQEVSILAKSCTAGEGNIVKWSDLKDKGEGDVKLICTSTCV